MPFAAIATPSFALIQLQGILRKNLEGRVSVDVRYLNHDVARHLGVDLYSDIATGTAQKHSGLGEWFFRQLAFPDSRDNAEEYFAQYYPVRDAASSALKKLLLQKRQGLNDLFESLIDQYELTSANIVGFSSMFSQTIACFAMARKLKERDPEILTVMGGANCEWPMGEEIARNVDHLDFIFSGPSLRSFPTFVENVVRGRREACFEINGVFPGKAAAGPRVRRNGNTKVRGDELDINEPIELDYTPFLDALEWSFPSERIEPTLFFETSRGCWWGERKPCKFCGLNGAICAYRSMKPETALKQFKALFRYANRCRRFESVDSIMPTDYIRDVLPFVSAPQGCRIFYEVRAGLKERDVRALSGSGVRLIQPGIEALSTVTLKSIDKGTTVFSNLLLLRECLQHDVYPMWNLLIGFPEEPVSVYEKYVQVIPLLVHLPPPTGVHTVRFDRYSHYFGQAGRYGLDLVPFDFYRLSYPFPEDSVRTVAYYFADRNVGADRAAKIRGWQLRLSGLVRKWRDRWNKTDVSSFPKLYLDTSNDAVMVFDTRQGNVVKWNIAGLGFLILELSRRPVSLERLGKELKPPISAKDIELEVIRLAKSGLIFREGDTIFSLVSTAEPRIPFFAGNRASRYRTSSTDAREGRNLLPSDVFLR